MWWLVCSICRVGVLVVWCGCRLIRFMILNRLWLVILLWYWVGRMWLVVKC